MADNERTDPMYHRWAHDGARADLIKILEWFPELRPVARELLARVNGHRAAPAIAQEMITEWTKRKRGGQLGQKRGPHKKAKPRRHLSEKQKKQITAARKKWYATLTPEQRAALTAKQQAGLRRSRREKQQAAAGS